MRGLDGCLAVHAEYMNGLVVIHPVCPFLAGISKSAVMPRYSIFFEWHCLLGHAGKGGTWAVLKDLGIDLAILKGDVERVRTCKDCIKGKLHKRTFCLWQKPYLLSF